MKKLYDYLHGKEIRVMSFETATITDVDLFDNIHIEYETEDGGSGSWELRSDTVTEFLDAPFGDVPTKLSEDVYVLAQTGYSDSKGVCVMTYNSATDELKEQYLSSVE